MKKHLGKLLVAAFAAASLLAGCASIGGSAEKEHKLVILHTNDHHGSVITRKDKEGVGHGGLAERATFIKQARAEAEAEGADVLLLDAGDLNTGMAVSNMFSAEPDIVAYNAMGYEAIAFGNHEFDSKLDKLQAQMKKAEFPWLAANVKTGSGYLGKPYIIKKYKGYKVGIFGLTTLRTLVIASPDKSLTFTDEIETAKEMVNVLRNKEKVDVVIMLSHVGNVKETADQTTTPDIAKQVSGIDLIIDGHSHTKMDTPLVENGTPIVSSNEWGKCVGKAELTVSKKAGAKLDSWKSVEITDKAFPPDAEMTALLKPYLDAAEAELKKVVLKTTAEFEFGSKRPRYQEMASGDLLCDATVGYVEQMTGIKVDFAMHNGGNIRTSLPKGDVTKEQVITMLPFENYVYVLTLPGSVVKELFEFIPTLNQGAGGFPQVSKEVKYTLTYDADGRNGSISDITIGGKPIDVKKTYRMATNDYMAGGGDGYVALKKCTDTFNTRMLVNDMFIEYLKTVPQPVTPTTDGRITVIGGK